jgi:hypothetical protein
MMLLKDNVYVLFKDHFYKLIVVFHVHIHIFGIKLIKIAQIAQILISMILYLKNVSAQKNYLIKVTEDA